MHMNIFSYVESAFFISLVFFVSRGFSSEYFFSVHKYLHTLRPEDTTFQYAKHFYSYVKDEVNHIKSKMSRENVASKS